MIKKDNKGLIRIYLCKTGCCPTVEIGKTYVKIGEKGNLCTLTKKEWANLKRKITKGEA